MRLFMLGLQ
jgi:ribonuclease HI